uniref:Uncharacterized protein n=1 Tax=Strongyloides papillosus TaxID=174720 RepID=A0A0N5BUX4_STREA
MEPSRINDGKSSIGFEKLGNHDPLVWIESTTTRIQLVVNPDQQLEKFLSLLPKDLQALIISDSDVTNLDEASSILKQFLGNSMDSLLNELKSLKLDFSDYLPVLGLCNRAKPLIKRLFNCSARESEIALGKRRRNHQFRVVEAL